MRKINEIIVHCSATPEGKDFTVQQIRQWHLQRGFSDIGYHYVVYRDGKAGTSYMKRFNVTSITRDREYDLTQGKPGSRVLYFTANPNG